MLLHLYFKHVFFNHLQNFKTYRMKHIVFYCIYFIRSLLHSNIWTSQEHLGKSFDNTINKQNYYICKHATILQS
jgi:hypothetical protein